MAKKIGVILSGCGVMDGAEIHESVITLLALDRAGCHAVCMAPDAPQMHVVNHLTGEPVEGQSRNILEESARIARGNIKPISAVSIDDLDAIIIPGGFGAAKNLCDFAVKGAAMEVNNDVAGILQSAHQAGKPICALCISPVILAKVFSPNAAEITVGNEAGTVDVIQQLGATHNECTVAEITIDQKNKLVTTPAYMLATSISEAADGIEKAIQATLDLID